MTFLLYRFSLQRAVQPIQLYCFLKIKKLKRKEMLLTVPQNLKLYTPCIFLRTDSKNLKSRDILFGFRKSLPQGSPTELGELNCEDEGCCSWAPGNRACSSQETVSRKMKNASCHFLTTKLKHQGSNSSRALFFTYSGNIGNLAFNRRVFFHRIMILSRQLEK